MWVSYFAVILLITSQVSSQIIDDANVTESTQSIVTTSPIPLVSSSTPKPENLTCETHNNDCTGCVKNTKCYYCETNNRCNSYKEIIDSNECAVDKSHYLTCKLNFKILVIGLSVAAGVVLLIIVIACCCCCCKRKGIKISKDELKWARQRDERKQVAEERRKERAERTEQIRQKYGLLLDASGLVKDSNPYQRFDD